VFQYRITERKAVWAIKHRTFVNNFAYETAEINIEVKHLLSPKKKRLPRVSWQSF
jgi:hypothetical protein